MWEFCLIKNKLKNVYNGRISGRPLIVMDKKIHDVQYCIDVLYNIVGKGLFLQFNINSKDNVPGRPTN